MPKRRDLESEIQRNFKEIRKVYSEVRSLYRTVRRIERLANILGITGGLMSATGMTSSGRLMIPASLLNKMIQVSPQPGRKMVLGGIEWIPDRRSMKPSLSGRISRGFWLVSFILSLVSYIIDRYEYYRAIEEERKWNARKSQLVRELLASEEFRSAVKGRLNSEVRSEIP